MCWRIPHFQTLTVARVQHDSDTGSESPRRDVGAELGSHHTRVAVRASDSAPDDANLGSLAVSGSLVDVGNALMGA